MTEAQWTGFTSVSDCIICHEIDKPTMEFEYKNRRFTICKDCIEGVRKE